MRNMPPLNYPVKPIIDLNSGFEVPRALNKTELGHYKELKLFNDSILDINLKPAN